MISKLENSEFPGYQHLADLNRKFIYKLSKPETDAGGGGFTDWFISTYHRPAMTVEISYLVGETNPPLSIFQKEWKRNRYVGIKLAKEAKKMAN